MAEPVEVYVITNGIMKHLYRQQQIINVYKAGKAKRDKRKVGYDLITKDGLLMEKV